MSNILKAGNLIAAQGTKVQGYLPVLDTGLQMPITLINGTGDGKTVVITGGTHGGEYPGVETSIRLAAKLQPEHIKGQIIIIHPVNTAAYFAKLQYVNPLDGKNLNREYPGKATGTITEKIAYVINTELFSQADFYMDLHGGDIHEALIPFVIYTDCSTPEVNQASKEAASLLGIKYVVGSDSRNGSFGYAGQIGIPGFLGEIGQCGLWTEKEVVAYMRGVENVLKHLKVLPGAVEDLGEVTYVHRMTGVNATATGNWYPSVKPSDIVKTGQKIGDIKDFFQTVLAEYHSPKDGVVLYVASSLAINNGDPIYALS